MLICESLFNELSLAVRAERERLPLFSLSETAPRVRDCIMVTRIKEGSLYREETMTTND